MSSMTIVAGSADGLRPPLAFRAGRMRPQLQIRFSFGQGEPQLPGRSAVRVNEKVLTKLS